MEEKKRIHIAVVTSAGYTHIVPILQFSKRLVRLNPYMHITCIIPTIGSPSSATHSFLQTLPPNIAFTLLPPVKLNDMPQDTDPAGLLQLTVSLSLPFIHSTLKSLTLKTTPSLPPPVALVVDTFAAEALNFAEEFNLLSYVYFPGAATTVSLHFFLPKLDEETDKSLQFRDLDEPVRIPGCVPLHGKDLYTPAQDRSIKVYRVLLDRLKMFFSIDGGFVNSFLGLENGPLRGLSEGKGYPKVCAVGPIVSEGGSGGDVNWLECVDWLDRQRFGSVLFVCFGSGGTLSQEQMNELACGLELSGHRFLWVVRPPSNNASAGYFGAEDDVDPLQFLPGGFLERTKDQGLVVPLWAPQVKVLAHGSVRGFLSHCGWNSTLESVMQGVPMITWPLFAEQRMNAVLITEGLKVGLWPRVNDESGLVEKEEIAAVIKRLMEGEEGTKLHERMRDLKEAATDALKEDGSSTKALSEVILKWEKLAQERYV